MSRKFNKNGRRVTKSRKYVVTQWWNRKGPGLNLEAFSRAFETMFNGGIKKNRKLVGRRLKRFSRRKDGLVGLTNRNILLDRMIHPFSFSAGISVGNVIDKPIFYRGSASIEVPRDMWTCKPPPSNINIEIK